MGRSLIPRLLAHGTRSGAGAVGFAGRLPAGCEEMIGTCWPARPTQPARARSGLLRSLTGVTHPKPGQGRASFIEGTLHPRVLQSRSPVQAGREALVYLECRAAPGG